MYLKLLTLTFYNNTLLLIYSIYLLFNLILRITKMTKEEQTKPTEETQKSIPIFIFRGILG